MIWVFSRIMIRVLESVLMGIIILLGFRFLFRLVGASSFTPAVGLLYTTSNFLIEPFRSIVNNQIVDIRSVFSISVFDAVALVAIAVYIAATYLIIAFLETLVKFPHSPSS